MVGKGEGIGGREGGKVKGRIEGGWEGGEGGRKGGRAGEGRRQPHSLFLFSILFLKRAHRGTLCSWKGTFFEKKKCAHNF